MTDVPPRNLANAESGASGFRNRAGKTQRRSDEHLVKHIYELSQQLSEMRRLADARLQEVIVLSRLVMELQEERQRPSAAVSQAAVRKQNKKILELVQAKLLPSRGPGKKVLARIQKSGYFDEQWYLEKNPDVARSNIGAVEHYLKFGEREGRDPGPRFDVRAYVESHPELKDSTESPLLHFLDGLRK